MKNRCFFLITLFNGILMCDWTIKGNCCPGYQWDIETETCTECPPGYHGLGCTRKCLYPNYGRSCQKECSCPMDSCSFVNGCKTAMPCSSGYFGHRCELKCKYPGYGLNCTMTCNCREDNCIPTSGCIQQTSQGINSNEITAISSEVMLFEKKNDYDARFEPLWTLCFVAFIPLIVLILYHVKKRVYSKKYSSKKNKRMEELTDFRNASADFPETINTLERESDKYQELNEDVTSTDRDTETCEYLTPVYIEVIEANITLSQYSNSTGED